MPVDSAIGHQRDGEQAIWTAGQHADIVDDQSAASRSSRASATIESRSLFGHAARRR
jgi:hypothetical protein